MKIVKVSGGLILLLIVITLLAVVWLVKTESGLQWATARATQFTGGNFSVQSVSGNLTSPIEITGLRYQSVGSVIEIDSLLLSYNPMELIDREIQINKIIAGNIIVSNTGVEQKPEPYSPPNLNLPVHILIDEARVQSLRLIDKNEVETLLLKNAHLRAYWRGDEISIEQASVNHPAFGDFSALASVLVKPNNMLELKGVTLKGPGEINVQGSLSLFDRNNDFTMSWQALQWPRENPMITSETGNAEFKGSWQDLNVIAELGLDKEAKINSTANWKDNKLNARITWKNLKDFRSKTPQWESSEGTLVFKGNADHYEFNANGKLLALKKQGRIDVQGSGDATSAVIGRAIINAADGITSVKGNIAWAPALKGKFELKLDKVNPAIIDPQWAGSLTGNVDLNFSQKNSEAPLVIVSKLDIFDSTLRNRDVVANGEVRVNGSQVSITELKAKSGKSSLELRGSATPPFNLNGRVDSPDLSDFAPGLAGSADVEFSLTGTPKKPGLIADGELNKVSYAGMAIEKARLDILAPNSTSVRANIEIANLVIGENVAIDTLNITTEGTPEDHTIKLNLSGQNGKLDTLVAAGYNFKNQQWSGRIDSVNLAPENIQPWKLEDPAAFNLGKVSGVLEPACVASAQGRACFQARYQKGMQRAAFRLDQLALAYFTTFMPPEWSAEGNVTGSGFVQLGNAGIEDARIDLELGEGKVVIVDKTLEFTGGQFSASNTGGPVVLDGKVAVAGADIQTKIELFASEGGLLMQPVKGTLTADFPSLEPLAVVIDQLGAAQGRASADLNIAGTVGKPLLDGEFKIIDATLLVDASNMELENINVSVTGEGGGQINIAGSAKAGVGTLKLNGNINPAVRPITAEMQLTGDRALLANLPEAEVWVTPDLKLLLNGEGLLVTGKVTLPKARIKPKGFSNSGIGPSSDQRIYYGDATDENAGMPIRAQIELTLGDDVKFDGFGLQTALNGSITVTEEPGRSTSARGELKLDGGRYEAYGQKLTIERGRLIYKGGAITDPKIDFIAQRQARQDLVVGISARGSLDKPSLDLYSSPSLPRQEQLSWLVLGRPLEQTGGSEDSAILASAALSLGVKGGNWLANKLGTGIGLDSLSVESDAGEGADQARVTIGKYLSPKLYISYGVGLFQPGHLLRLRYQLGNNFALQSETGINTGGDLLYAVEK